MSRRMQKADPPAMADENEGSNVKPGKAPIDYEESTEGISEESGEPPESAKSEDPASDSDHISHPRPEEGEEEQRGMDKSDDEEEEEEEEDEALKAENTDEEEGALMADAKRERNDESIKSLTAGDLNKSLNRLQRYAERGGTQSRKDNLLHKAQTGQDLSKSERAELFDLLGNKPQVKQPLAKSVTRGLQSNDSIQKALDVSEVPEGTLVRAMLGSEPLVLLREGDRIHALHATCSHAGGPLDRGTLVDGCVQCPWHGSRFRLADGHVQRGPAVYDQPRYEVRAAEGGGFEARRLVEGGAG